MCLFSIGARFTDKRNKGEPLLPLQVLQQVQDLRLDGNVQGGYRLVADHELGAHYQRSGNAHSLAAATIQLMRIGAPHAPVYAHEAHQVRFVCSAYTDAGYPIVPLVKLPHSTVFRIARKTLHERP